MHGKEFAGAVKTKWIEMGMWSIVPLGHFLAPPAPATVKFLDLYFQLVSQRRKIQSVQLYSAFNESLDADRYYCLMMIRQRFFDNWPEINIKPWGPLSDELREGNQMLKWIDRKPYAFWKGNPMVAATRMDLLKCNVSDVFDWNARVFAQDWASETQQGFKESNLASQCDYRYKIYIEGSAWSVSEKYILACDSLALVVTPKYYDFFTRGLFPLQHYWPIRTDDKCNSIKFAVDWGNRHKQKVQAIGKEASAFILEQVGMDQVYDYMFHLLNEYSKLLKFRPSVPKNSVEVSFESMFHHTSRLSKRFMMQSMVNETQPSHPCTLPPPFRNHELKKLLKRKENILKKVRDWEMEEARKKTENVV